MEEGGAERRLHETLSKCTQVENRIAFTAATFRWLSDIGELKVGAIISGGPELVSKRISAQRASLLESTELCIDLETSI